jgi:pilus assembly protein Flp/PilA
LIDVFRDRRGTICGASKQDQYPWEEGVMSKALQLLNRLAKDEEGAALVEYTVLLGIMLVAVVATIGLVGGWVNTKWTALWTALSAN